VQFNPGAGTASYGLSGLSVKDFGTLANAINNVPPVAATVSFQVQWQMLSVTDRKRLKVRDATQGFAGDFWVSTVAGATTLEWSATAPGFSFVSDPAATSASYFSALGTERNGVFFPQGSQG
jgi:hypothetical protein